MSAVKVTLPKLLAGLPQYGKGQLVQPVAWQQKYPDSFYKITRTKLRFKAPGEDAKAVASSSVADKGKAKEVAKEEDEFEDENEDEDVFGGLAEEEIQVGSAETGKPYGKAWGVLFWNGQAKIPTKNPRRSLAPDSPNLIIAESKVKGGLKQSWKPVDVSTLNAEIRQAVEALKTGPKPKLQTGYVQRSRADRSVERKDKQNWRKDQLKVVEVELPAGEVRAA